MSKLFDINLNRLVVFTAVVETGSITAAAKRLGLAKTMVSAHMQKLEAEIGSHLLVRTTRRLHLTEAGTLFYEACQKILLDTENAITQASSNTQQLRGKLRISTSIDFGASVIAPLTAELARQHPELRIEILSSDERVDMVSAGIDVAIRIGRLADSSHRAALIAYFEDWLVAHPSVLQGEMPRSPQDVAELPFVGLSVLPNPTYWTFTQAGSSSQSLRFNASVMANTASAVKAAVLAGAGMMVHPDIFVREEVAAGRLVRLLPEWSLPGGGIYAVYPQSVQRSQKVSVLIEALKARYA
ncbi:LysR family transcriptional regulator [Cellvibrio zantedeschiae]|uniref:LysR family transcriptional regulator n=1 Tax=Cellvibrio zantedeschiae TaxID=1237077 RepID=A0ABQ3B6X0_9GAMM|nr:LysR family transcriptional regulator [Cellvibrio zantedeschiae]GGY80940.1 LysR family transcriptional regulator [Cellvibrio zantedeschiae]